MRLVLKIGGSILQNETGDFNEEILKSYVSVIKKLVSEKQQIFIVVGGGKLARKYIDYARNLGSSESFCDIVGIESARLNALILISALKDFAYPFPLKDFNEVLKLLPLEKILVLGGTQPGQSTNAVAALLAEIVNANYLINLTNVDGVFTENPRINKNAKLLKQVTTDLLNNILSKESIKAGSYPLFDPLAIKIVKRSKIPTWIVNGKDPNNILKILKNEDIGTKIIP